MSLNTPDGIDIGRLDCKAPENRGDDGRVCKQIENIRRLYFSDLHDLMGFFEKHGQLIDKVTSAYYKNIAKGVAQEIDLMGRLTMALLALRDRFFSTPGLQTDCSWDRVEAALIENQGALNALAKMELAGHEPNVYHFDKEGFDIGTCSPESPLSGRNCVYDAQAEEYLRRYNPNVQFNGNAVEQANAMGVNLMTEEEYIKLQAKGGLDMNSSSWLKTSDYIRDNKGGIFGSCDDGEGCFYRSNVCSHGANLAWRGSLRVLWDKV